MIRESDTGAREPDEMRRERERKPRWCSRRQPVSGPRGALEASITSAKLHHDMLTGRSGSKRCQSQRRATRRDPEAHRPPQRVAAGEQERRSSSSRSFWRDPDPEAKAEQEKHARIDTQFDHLSRTVTCEKAGQSSKPRTARGVSMLHDKRNSSSVRPSCTAQRTDENIETSQQL